METEIKSTRQTGWFVCAKGKAIQHYTEDGGHSALCNKRFAARFAPLNDGSGWGYEIAESPESSVYSVCPKCEFKKNALEAWRNHPSRNAQEA